MTNVQPSVSVADVGAILGEGPVWVEAEQALYWVDIKGLKIFRLDVDGDVRSWTTPFRIGSLAPKQSGGFIAGTEHGFAAVDLSAGAFTTIVDPEPDWPTNRFNDGKVDRQGRFWAGTMDDREEQASGALYRLDPSLSWTRADADYQVTNGPAFSVDGKRMYHNDSARQQTYVFELNEMGIPSNRQLFAAFGAGEGYPDGMTVDRDDCLWIAFWDGWCIRRYSPAGNCIGKFDLPVQRPTSCAFGGPDLSLLYVTSASVGLNPSVRAQQPFAGNLLMLETGFSGVADVPFEG